MEGVCLEYRELVLFLELRQVLLVLGMAVLGSAEVKARLGALEGQAAG